MPNFRSLKEFERYMNKILHDSMNEVGNKVENELKDQIDKDVYATHSPTSYDRTYELRDSVEYSPAQNLNGQVIVEVGHNYDKINPHSPNQHMSVIGGSDVSNELPQWINNGTIGNIFGEGVWTKPRPYMDNTKEKIKDNNLFEKELKKSLRKRGIKTD